MYTATMGLSEFRDEPRRRARLETIRYWAARWGYRGRVSFEHSGIHGREHGLVIVRVEVAP